jgi:hypothetical protein
MKLSQLCCLHLSPNGLFLQLAKVEDLIKKDKKVKNSLEIDLDKKKWKYFDEYGPLKQGWADIGKTLDWKKYFIKLVFDPTDFNQLKEAFSEASHFFSDNQTRME